MLQVPAMSLQGVSLKCWQRCRRLCRSRCNSRHRDVGRADRRRTIPRETEDDEERAKRQRTEKKAGLEMEVSNVAKINDRRRVLDLRRDGWELEDVRHRDAAMFYACELRPQSHPHALHQAETNWNQHGIYAEHKGHKGWDTCANSSSHDEEHPKQHRVQCHDHPWKRDMTVNISHVERRQHPPPFAEP